jgi:hypothetical protein
MPRFPRQILEEVERDAFRYQDAVGKHGKDATVVQKLYEKHMRNVVLGHLEKQSAGTAEQVDPAKSSLVEQGKVGKILEKLKVQYAKLEKEQEEAAKIAQQINSNQIEGAEERRKSMIAMKARMKVANGILKLHKNAGFPPGMGTPVDGELN